ncbi:MFS transporter, partial [Streptomyces sp. SID10853]|nr:MFS transporter [Streptomyces sp. SID10853]
HGALLASAHRAFVHGLDFAAVGAAVAMAGAAVLSVVLLRGARAAGEPDGSAAGQHPAAARA